MGAHLDHLVIAGTDLLALVAWWRNMTGTTPARGGSHAGYGTRNALVGIDSRTYIELIAPDPDQPDPPDPRPFGIDDLAPLSFGLVTYALAVDDLDDALTRVRASGIDPGRARSMSRALGDGRLLEWRLAIPPPAAYDGAQPFLIEWGVGMPHPASGLAAEVSITELTIAHPAPAPLIAAMDAIGSPVPIREAPVPTVAAVLTTAGGQAIEL